METDNYDDRIQVLKKYDVLDVIKQIALSGEQDDPFYICDVADLIRKDQNWKTTMPRVTTYYAVKCNDSRIVLETLAALGTGFDCASKEEIRKVLSLGVHPSRIVFANPTKIVRHLEYAAEVGVELMTFDNEMELHKIKNTYPNAKLLIRIKCDDVTALYVLGRKYGCDHETEASKLLQVAVNLGLDVVGVAFHIGSGSKNPSIFEKAFANSRHVFDEAAKLGYRFKMLDIGGGYPGEKNSSIKEIGEIINAAADKYFPDPEVKIIAEPGKYYVNSAFTLACSIHSLKPETTENNERAYAYYVDVSVYGALIPIVFNETYSFKPLLVPEGSTELFHSIIWGPTCDVSDKLTQDVLLPEMGIGDWIVTENAGAYTMSIASEFNGVSTPMVHSVVDEESWLFLTQKAPFPFNEDKFLVGSTMDAYRTGLRGPNRTKTNYF